MLTSLCPRQFFRGLVPGFVRIEVVRGRDGLQLSLAVTLVMATVVAFLRPYAHAQALSGLAHLQWGDTLCLQCGQFSH